MLKCSSRSDCWIPSNAGPCDQCGAYCEHLVHVQLDLRLLCSSCCPHFTLTTWKQPRIQIRQARKVVYLQPADAPEVR
jgi:hypothetical protein